MSNLLLFIADLIVVTLVFIICGTIGRRNYRRFYLKWYGENPAFKTEID